MAQMFYLKALVMEGLLQVTLLFPCRSPSSTQEEQVGDSLSWLFCSFPVNQLDQNLLLLLGHLAKHSQTPRVPLGCLVLSCPLAICCCQLVPSESPA